MQKGGHIEVIFGPMFSGKSTELLRRIKRHNIAKKRCLVVKFRHDTRYALEEMATHDKQMIQAYPATKVEEIEKIYQEYDVVGIDEGQFFPDLVLWADKMAQDGKVVIVAALDATFQRKPFGPILELVPLAEKVCKLNSVCVKCGGDAVYTHRTIKCDQIEVIGGNEMYIPLCRTCFTIEQHEDQLDKPRYYIYIYIYIYI